MKKPCMDELITGFVEQTKEILRDDLVGVYLHGSAVMGCFNPKKSDIDLIIVVHRSLSDSVKKAYMDMVIKYNASGPAKGIEMSVVRKDVCKPFIYPTPYELHFSAGHLARYTEAPDDYVREMSGTDKDLAAHFTIINKRGKCLYGAPIPEAFAAVPHDDYMDSILYDIARAPENIAEDTMYLTLNLARVLAFRQEGLVLSKEEGGEWALNNLPEEYRPLIMDALSEYSESAEIIYNEVLARRYAEYITKRLERDDQTAVSGLFF